MHDILRNKDPSSDLTWGDSYSADNMLAGVPAPRRPPRAHGRAGGRVRHPSADLRRQRRAQHDRRRRADLRQPPLLQPLAGGGMGVRPDGRIVAPPLLSLLDRDLAVDELDRVLGLGRPPGAPPARARPAAAARSPTRGTTRSGRRTERGPGTGRVPHRRQPLRRSVGGVGRGPRPAGAGDVGVPVGLRARRPADHGDIRRPDLRQHVRSLPQPARAQHRERLRLGPLPTDPARQEEGHGPLRPVGRVVARPGGRATPSASSATCPPTRRTTSRP